MTAVGHNGLEDAMKATVKRKGKTSRIKTAKEMKRDVGKAVKSTVKQVTGKKK